MSSRLVGAVALLALWGAACGGSARGGEAGRLSVERVTRPGATLLDARAAAWYCPGESLLSVVAVGRSWSGGLALRVVLPLRERRTFVVARHLAGDGTAAGAFRPLGGVARFAVGGSVTLRPSREIDGEFQATVTDSVGPNIEFRGRISRVPYDTMPESSCRR
jgi:hypothetical protein